LHVFDDNVEAKQVAAYRRHRHDLFVEILNAAVSDDVDRMHVEEKLDRLAVRCALANHYIHEASMDSDEKRKSEYFGLATKYLKSADLIDNADARVCVCKGLVYLLQKRERDRALKSFDNALQSDSDSIAARLGQVRCPPPCGSRCLTPATGDRCLSKRATRAHAGAAA
jgi:hypothetical protein